ncbi:Conserved_hypothetical protein [Hexamita inflata]|uniref:Uncharacterized protein n=1 Tax=Hexamita inflata TaxID=28002 RepID=A0AA86NVU4_9EUKA|nr:Conserved hypothetical protein [Hexamita inflata]
MDNTSVVLSKQSKNPTFTATMINDSSKDSIICNNLFSQTYIFSLDFQGFIYTYPTHQHLSKHLDIEFMCEDTINNCAAAFQATSVQFSLVFPETNTLVQDVVSTFKIGKYDRLECLLNSYVQYNSNDNSFIIATTPGNCVLQYQQNKMATASLFVYPDYELSKQFSLSGISSLSQLIPLLQFNCDTDFVDTDKRVCNRIMKEFQSSLSNVINFTLSLPATVPDGQGLYTRQSEFSIFEQITTVTSNFAKDFDCYLPFQEIVFYQKIIKIQFKLNSSAINCKKPFNEFIGDIDQIIRMLRIIGSDGKSVQFKFTGPVYDLQGTILWLECSNDLFGEQTCLENLNIVRSMSNPIGMLSREFLKNGVTVKQVQNTVFPRKSRHGSPYLALNDSHVCFTCANAGERPDFYPVSIDLMPGSPRFHPESHQEMLSIRGLVYFPSNLTVLGQTQYYCFYYNISNTNLYEQFRRNIKNVSALVQAFGTKLAAEQIQMEDVTVKVRYYLVFCAFMVLSSGLRFVLARRYEIVRGGM